jgi:hypothetical protein
MVENSTEAPEKAKTFHIGQLTTLTKARQALATTIRGMANGTIDLHAGGRVCWALGILRTYFEAEQALVVAASPDAQTRKVIVEYVHRREAPDQAVLLEDMTNGGVRTTN